MAKVKFNLQERLEKQQEKSMTHPSELRREKKISPTEEENAMRATFRSPTGMPTRRLGPVEKPDYKLGGRGIGISFEKRGR